MKKVFYATLALGALVIASCQKENSAVLPKVDSPVFTASLNEDTKTVLNETTKKSEWVSGDAIRVLNGTNTTDCDAIYTTTEGGDTATFTTEVEGYTGTQFIAVYPGTKSTDAWWNASEDKKVNKLWLKPEQTAKANGYDSDAHVAVAYTDTKSFVFSNAVSLLKFTCGSDNVTEVCVYANSPANAAESKDVLSGNFDFDTEGKVATTASYAGSEYVYNYVKITGKLVKGTTYYIACLPTTFTEGFTVEVVSNGVKGENKTTSKEYTLKRNTILDLGKIEYVEKAIDTRTLYFKPGDWNNDTPKFDAWIWGGSISGQWADFEPANAEGTYYKITIPKGITGLNIYRRSPSEHTSHQFDNNYWNKKEGISIDDTINCIAFTNWEGTGGYTTSTAIPTI